MIKINNMSFKYQSSAKNVLEDINLSISTGESIGIIGANGVGKSTLLKLLVGIETSYQGEILVNDIKVTNKNLKKIREKIGYVFQDSDAQLFMPTVYEDVAFAPQNFGLKPDEVKKRVEEALKSVGIEDIKNKPIYHLSGGEKKLVSIATVLSMRPEILIFDEPSITLDPKNRRKFINVIKSLDKTKLIASHDLDMILDTCSRTVLINNNRIIKIGDTNGILKDKELLESNGLELPLSLSRI